MICGVTTSGNTDGSVIICAKKRNTSFRRQQKWSEKFEKQASTDFTCVECAAPTDKKTLKSKERFERSTQRAACEEAACERGDLSTVESD